MIKVLTNIRALQRYAPPYVSVELVSQSALNNVLPGMRKDAVLLTLPDVPMMLWALAIKFLSLGTVRLYFYDVLLAPQGKGLRGWLSDLVRRTAMGLASRIYLVHLDFETYALGLGVQKEKLEWIGFKCNNFERLGAGEPKPSIVGEYVLACGQSYRDYPTFIDAMRALSIPAVILLPPDEALKAHGSFFSESDPPPHLRIMAHDGRSGTWDRFLRNARFVVLPLRADTIQPAGISVCLEAMAFGKPVIMSQGPLTHGDLFAKGSLTVPPQDAPALASAIRRLWDDEELRGGLAAGAAEIARRMGGVARICNGLIAAIISDIAPRRPDDTELVASSKDGGRKD